MTAVRTSARALRPGSTIEALESRRFLDGRVDLGEIVGRRVLFGQVVQPDFGEFAVGNLYDLSPSGDVKILATDIRGNATVFGDIALSLEQPGTVGGSFGFSDNDFFADETIEGPFFGDFELNGDNQALVASSYTLVIAADRAPASGTSATVGRNYGTLSEVGAPGSRDFIGHLFGGGRGLLDKFDMHLFDLPVAGELEVNVRDFEIDVSLGQLAVSVSVFRDGNNNCRFDSGETLDSSAQMVLATDTYRFEDDVPAGRYGVLVQHGSGSILLGGTNYAIQLIYDADDNAGNSLDAARNINVLGESTRSFTDLISSEDTSDFYKFTSEAGGPFVFNARLTDVPEGANFDVDFILDRNNDGVVGSQDVLASGNQPGNQDENFFGGVGPGTYFVRVKRVSGEGTYKLSVAMDNTDEGGNTLPAARPLGALNGRRQFADFVSSSDTADIFKFTTAKAGTISASFPTVSGAGANADLSLIQDLDNDGVIDNNEILAVSTNGGNAAESISRVSDAGTYFVRVLRVTNNPSYQLTIAVDTAGDSPANARSLSSTGSVTEFVGTGDLADVFRVSLATPRRLGVSVGDVNGSVTVAVARDANGDGAIAGTEVLGSQVFTGPALKRLRFSAGQTLFQNITTAAKAGTFFLVVTRNGTTETNYSLQLSTSNVDLAGNTLARARDLSVLGPSPRVFRDFVGDGSIDLADDTVDLYKFTLGDRGPFVITATLDELSANADIQLVRDFNSNGRVDSGEVIRESLNTGTAPDSINTLISSSRGPFFIKVQRTSGQATYRLTLNATSTDTADNTLAEARDLGTLTDTLAVSESVGVIDPEDFFKFTTASSGTLYGWIIPQNDNANLEIIRDVNNNGTINTGDVLASGVNPGRQSELINNVVLPVAGTYFARVLSAANFTAYSMTLRFTPGPAQTPFGGSAITIVANAPTVIEAENFDDGGEEVAFHDTDDDNDGNNGFRGQVGVDIKNTSDNGGSVRVSDIRAGEFLEYTVSVPSGAFFNLDFRVGSPEPGAVFHMEVDNIDVTGPLTIPDTNSFDSMTNVKKQGINLNAGPHVIKVAFDVEASANSRAGTINFIKFRPVVNTVTTLGPTADAFVRSGQFAEVNFGTAVELISKQSGGDNRRDTYLKFDLTNINDNGFTNAKLRLFGRLNNPNSTNIITDLFTAADNNWSETGITFNNRPAIGGGGVPLASTVVTDNTLRFYEWDVSAFLLAEQAAGRDVVTFILKNPQGADPFTVFNSREAVNNKPSLLFTQ